jgi:hypothetical protein
LQSAGGQALLAVVASRAVAWGFALLGAHGHVQAAFAEWDSGHYLTIVAHGYPSMENEQWAFYPLYPSLARTVALGVAISTVSFWAGLALLYGLAEEHFGYKVARRTVWIAAFFPASFWLTAYFPEGLFFFASVAAFVAARRRLLAVAAFLGIDASLAHGSSAISMVVPLLLIPQRARWERLIAASGPAIGVLIFFFVAFLATGHPLAPVNAEKAWAREFNGLFGAVGPAVRDTLAALAGENPARFSYEIGWLRELEFCALILVVVAMVWCLRRLPLAYGAYLFAFLALDLTYFWPEHPLLSFLRFAGSLFPVYIFLGAVTRERRLWTVLVFEAVGLAILAWRFGHGGWIA